MLSSTKASILCFLQKFTGNTISLNILFVPRENPLLPFASELIPGNAIPAFAESKLKFVARLIPSLESLPSPAIVDESVTLHTGLPGNAKNIFLALQDTFTITLPSNELKSLPKNDTFIRKYLPRSYRNAFDFSHPRSPKYGVTDDAYLCAIKKESPPGKRVYSTDDVSWGKVFALALRQPVLAEQLGMIYKTTFELPVPGYFKEGGWLYVDLAEESDYYERAVSDAVLIKKYAARLPKLTSKRVLFTPIQFLVTEVPQNGNFDPLFIEAADFDDGFANIVHCAQPQKANPILEQGQDGLPPVKDFGIRIGWEDEQILDWHNRLLKRPDHLPSGIPATPENIILDVPVGILSYRIDVKDADDPIGKWHSLNRAKGLLKIADVELGLFEGELGVEVAPTQMDGFKEGIFWLPSYFSQWDGNSVVLKDDKAAELYGLQDAVPKAIKPVDIDLVPLRYGKTYEFRVRLADMTGGGPEESDDPH
ncbi:MAG: hypothetical protein M3352_06690, partial [Bacteroidota bacterium]|nr:hypothetical protein [Bacteroidota bacterium]